MYQRMGVTKGGEMMMESINFLNKRDNQVYQVISLMFSSFLVVKTSCCSYDEQKQERPQQKNFENNGQ
jgi:hypothetical protein